MPPRGHSGENSGGGRRLANGSTAATPVSSGASNAAAATASALTPALDPRPATARSGVAACNCTPRATVTNPTPAPALLPSSPILRLRKRKILRPPDVEDLPLPPPRGHRGQSSFSDIVNTVAPRKSPYEERWPDFYLPGWATKWLSPRDGPPVPDNKRVCFVHVGKTAGSTIGCALGFPLHCHGTHWHPDGVLPHYTTNVLHSNVNDCPLDAAYYLVTLRDPVARIQSWFLYEQSALAPLRDDCPFATLQDLALKGLQKNSKESSQKCQDRAKRAITGEQRFGYHNAHHYAYHMAQIPFNASIAAIRSEHMVQDWNAMEVLLGGKADSVTEFPRKNVGVLVRSSPSQASPGEGRHSHSHSSSNSNSHSSNSNSSNSSSNSNSNTTPSLVDPRYLSPEARRLVCFYLCDEIQGYKQLLHRAINLQPRDVAISMNELRVSCPHEADVAACPYYELRVDVPVPPVPPSTTTTTTTTMTSATTATAT